MKDTDTVGFFDQESGFLEPGSDEMCSYHKKTTLEPPPMCTFL